MEEQISDELRVLNKIDNSTILNKSFIYKKTNNSVFEAIPLKKLFGVIADIGDQAFRNSYIPNELIHRVDLSVETPPVSYKKDNNIVYYSPFLIDSKENVLSIIRLINSFPSVSITLYLTYEIYEIVKDFANENIIFCRYERPDEILINASLVITHGYNVRSFILQEVPTFVVGPTGIGGLVTPDNISYFLRNNFMGRPGGEMGEYVPSQVLVDELLEVENKRDLTKIISENSRLLKEYLRNESPNSIDSVITSIKDLYKNMNDSDKKNLLRPILATNVELMETENQLIIIRRKEINDVLFTIPESEIGFIKDLEKGLTCLELKDNYKLDEDDFWEVIFSLWECKAITLSL